MRKYIRLLGAAFALLLLPFQGQGQTLATASLDDLWDYADAHGAVSRGAEVQTELARLQTAAAIANTVNLRGTASLSVTDNFALPVNFLPAEIFGGPAGTFRAVTFGQQFVNVASIAPQLDIVNPSTWARVSSARTSKELTEVSNALSRRQSRENIATAYYNYQSAGDQLARAQQTLLMADTIATVVGNRYAEGIARQQDVNNALVNRANLADFAQQLQTRRAQQLLALQAMLGISDSNAVVGHRAASPTSAPNGTGNASSNLLTRQSQLQADLQRAELLANRLLFMPTVSVVAGFNWQQNSNESVFNSSTWIRSRFVGLKLSVPIPTETKLWSQAEEYRINLKMKEINARQSALQESIQNQQIDLDVQRAMQALSNATSVANLKQENLQRSRSNYLEGIITLDQYLTAFTDALNADMSKLNAYWNLELQFSRLELYN